ncbi:hypothetical protein GWK08_18885 [Leptobacterium flavescens]|uniref:DUF1295 domain-containing protein n=2 Tax=Leptobacterium flavescens TaxID=472055 RepID=A0A6P0UU27_9FLAO|nr:hypothetical protein [Leptobacterium flavescens]
MALLLSRGPVIFINLWMVFQLLGIGIMLWGAASMGNGNYNIQPEVKSDFLVERGIYKWIRNPMYLGILLFYIPTVISQPQLIKWGLYISLIIILLLKIYREEHFLSQKFGEQFGNYKKRTSRLIPGIF